MNTEKIYELLNGKALSILDQQPSEIIVCQNELDDIMNTLKHSLSSEQLKLLNAVMNKYTELITLSDNFILNVELKLVRK